MFQIMEFESSVHVSVTFVNDQLNVTVSAAGQDARQVFEEVA